MKTKNPTPDMIELLRRCGSNDPGVMTVARHELAKALELPLQKGVLVGDITDGIFEVEKFEPGQSVEYPIDFFTPTSDINDFKAYVVPGYGRTPEKTAQGDYVSVPTYFITNSFDWTLKYIKEARWPVVSRGLEVMRAGIVAKHNEDAWRLLLTTGEARNLVIYDANATAGLFTKRLVSLMDITMTRRAGGNTSSINRGKMTDLYMSVEAKADCGSWDLTEIPDAIRTQIFLNGPLPKIGDVVLHDLVELGVGMQFQDYFDVTLGGTMPTDKEEIVVGLDLLNRDSFMRPVRGELEIFEDLSLHRQLRAGIYAISEGGWASLSSVRILLGAL